MRYAAAFLLLGALGWTLPAAAQEIIVEPTVTYYAPSVPVTTYYAPSVAMPVTSYYAPAPYATYYAPSVPVTSYYAPAVAYAPAPAYYVPRRVARRWYRNGYWW